MKSFNKNRHLEILIIHSELICQNDAIQTITKQVRVPRRFTKFRFEKLYRVAQIIFRKRFTQDYDFFVRCRN